MGKLLPDEIVYRKKMGFSFPWELWLKNDLKTFCESRIINISKRPHINELEVISLWNNFLLGKPTATWTKVWLLVVLEHWMQKNGVN